MAENKHKKSDKKSSGDSGRKLKWIVRGCIALVILAVLSWCIFKLPKMFFFQNQRVKFRNLEIDSTGYWQKQHKLLLERIGLEYGTNMFTIDTGEIRKKLEKIPSIESAEVRFHLPDTLKIKITERIPRAALYAANSAVVIDSNGVMMKRAESSANHQKLPIIKNLRNQKQLKTALNLIMCALSNYPDIAIQEISLANPEELVVILYYRERKRCIVRFPASSDEDYNYLLSVLQTTILRNDTNWQIYDLRYRGSIVGR